MSEWLPIETAPKDGTAILVCNAESNGYGHSHAVVMWIEDEDTYVAERPNGETGGWAMDDGHDWFDYRHYTRGLRRNLAEPTHWMPLPELPK